MQSHIQKIISLLFFSGDAFSIHKLSTILQSSREEVIAAINQAQDTLTLVGLSINILNDTVSLTTHAECASFINEIRKKDVQDSLSPAAVETLTLILYRQPIKKVDIDYIRGVNSQFILRNLYAKGLITREKDPSDERSHIYKPTLALLEFLGLENIESLPDYEAVRTELMAKEEVLQEEINA